MYATMLVYENIFGDQENFLSRTSSFITGEFPSDLSAVVNFLPKSANTIFD